MKTGNTALTDRGRVADTLASMEPGHEDREYLEVPPASTTGKKASMEPGHEDREYAASPTSPPPAPSLNGARS